jgi:hypothetical protein
MLSASPASADAGHANLTTANAAAAVTWTPVPGGHFCQSTGFDSQRQQGVACNNFYQGYYQGQRAVVSEIELKCGDSSGLLPCTSALAIGNLDGGPVYSARCVRPGCPTAGYKVVSPYFEVLSGCGWVSATVNAQPGRGGFTFPDGTQMTMRGALISQVYVCP